VTKRQREVKAARAKRKKALALLREANNVLFARRRRRRRLLRRPLRRSNPEETAFYTWLHDFEVLLPAVARTAGSGTFTSEDLIVKATQAADRMKGEVAARRPSSLAEVDSGRHIRRRRLGKHADWRHWQHVFDGLVHALAERSGLNSDAVIDRASELTDAMLNEIDKRRPRRSAK